MHSGSADARWRYLDNMYVHVPGMGTIVSDVCLLFVLVKDERAVGTAEAEAVGHCPGESTVFPRGEDVHALSLFHEVLNVGRLGHEIIVHHEERVNRLMDAGSSESVAREGLGRADHGLVALLCENALDAAELLRISDGR